MRKLATLLFSGGIDSTCCLKILLDAGYDVRPIFFDFGQAAADFERASVRALAANFGLEVAIVDPAGACLILVGGNSRSQFVSSDGRANEHQRRKWDDSRRDTCRDELLRLLPRLRREGHPIG
ncbi:MAG: 7-cyano-7-deazaguanine synthase [Devosia nanyangense]|uniref:7-cyano-7-deazaguanine synthase n=1 Tax=Devosia nanyangense TaxID=1228055 RepID=A0A933L309_9HYPH|nr:7-cyano-7-deazaguanine synthase [Devosia nanyangense]